ncbi:hypothetical protein J2T18_004962 [Paenibacillus polymyxa]|nr:hypothetical protein [Paenibacillus polymyxa]
MIFQLEVMGNTGLLVVVEEVGREAISFFGDCLFLLACPYGL